MIPYLIVIQKSRPVSPENHPPICCPVLPTIDAQYWVKNIDYHAQQDHDTHVNHSNHSQKAKSNLVNELRTRGRHLLNG